MNGADECAVELFLQKKIRFLDIEELVEAAVAAADYIEHPTLAELKESDAWARAFVRARQEGACE